MNENEEIKKIDKKHNEIEEIKKVNNNKENKDNNKKEDIKENEEIKKLDDNKENKDNNKKEENNEKDKKEIKYSSPVKKNKSKKKKKYSQECTSNTPIIIQFKPLSPKHGEIPIKDPDDLVPIYFNTSTINNIQIPKDYLNVIYYNLLNEEKINLKNFKAEYNYMNNQKEITEQMRSILIDWIIDVHGKFGFCDETLYMTVSIIDRYSSIKKITRNEYQCLGITALMISCKHEEINVPKVEDFIYITDNAYTKQEVFNMEIDILDKLKYNLLYPSPIKFYEYLSLHFGFDKKKHFLGKYLMETFLLDLICIKFKPSIISCACIYIVMKFFKMKNYKESYLKKWYMIEGKEGFELENGCGVKDCAQEMCNFVDNIGSTKYLSCQKKYSADDYCNISKLIVNYPENNNNKKDDKKEENKKE
jgi:cyclin B